MSNFGPHLFLDCTTNTNEKISNLELVFNFLNNLPTKIGMTKITQPYVFPYDGLIPEDRGITGTVIIAESHISIHTFSEKNYFFFDIFSCKPFNIEDVLAEVDKTFDIKSWVVDHKERGLHFPR